MYILISFNLWVKRISSLDRTERESFLGQGLVLFSMSLNFSNLFHFDLHCKSGTVDQGSQNVLICQTAGEKGRTGGGRAGGGERDLS